MTRSHGIPPGIVRMAATVLVFVMCVGCVLPSGGRPAAGATETAAVEQLLLEHLGQRYGRDGQPVVLSEVTWAPGEGLAAHVHYRLSLYPHPEITEDVLAAFAARVRTATPLAGPEAPEFDLRFVARAELLPIEGADTVEFWRTFRTNRFPAAHGALHLTGVAMDRTRTRSLAAYRLDCGTTCGYTRLLLVERVPEGWQVRQSIHLGRLPDAPDIARDFRPLVPRPLVANDTEAVYAAVLASWAAQGWRAPVLVNSMTWAPGPPFVDALRAAALNLPVIWGLTPELLAELTFRLQEPRPIDLTALAPPSLQLVHDRFPPDLWSARRSLYERHHTATWVELTEVTFDPSGTTAFVAANVPTGHVPSGPVFLYVVTRDGHRWRVEEHVRDHMQ